MRVFLLLNEDTEFHPRLLYLLSLHPEYQIIGVGGVRHKVPYQSFTSYAIDIINYWGVILSSKFFWRRICGHLADVLSRLGFVIWGPISLKQVCRERHVDYYEVDSVNDPKFREMLCNLAPDVIVSSQHQIFGEELLQIPEIACINRHGSLLPDYRGIAPIFWAMLRGEKRIGVTVHTMTEQVDKGKLLCQKWFYPLPSDSLFNNYLASYAVAEPAIHNALLMLKKGDLHNQPELPDGGQYCNHPRAEDYKAFRKMGFRKY